MKGVKSSELGVTKISVRAERCTEPVEVSRTVQFIAMWFRNILNFLKCQFEYLDSARYELKSRTVQFARTLERNIWNLRFGIWNFLKCQFERQSRTVRSARIWSLLIMFILTMTTSCDSENGLNCTQAPGDIQSFELDVDPFDKVVIFQRMGATFKQGPIQKVVVTTGENLFNDIELKVVDGQLQIVNNNGCNVVRDYGITQIEITSPNLTEIRTSTGEDLKSDGVLNYPNLTLLSEDVSVEEDFYNTDGDFRLQLNTQNLKIVSNNLSYFYLSGSVQYADITFLDGDGRIYAQDLEIQNAQIFHRGTSEWRMDVKQNIAGTINGYGDVILNTKPTTVDVDVTWRGRLIYLNN